MPDDPKHWKDEAPTEPEPRDFLQKTPPVFWWVAGGLALLTVIGLVAVVITETLRDDTGETAHEEVAAARDEPVTVTLTNEGFEPPAVDLPRNVTLIIANDSGEPCAARVEGIGGSVVEDEDMGVAEPGGEVNWLKDMPGQYEVSCEGSGDILRVTVP